MVIDICDMHKNYAGSAFEKPINRITHYAFGNAADFLFIFFFFLIQV